MYWWSYPSRIVFFIMLPVFLVAASLGYEHFALFGHPANYIKGNIFWIGIAGLLAFSMCAFAVEFHPIRSTPSYPSIPHLQMQKVIHTLFYITLLSYIIFLSPAFINPYLLYGLATGEISSFILRDELNRIPGVTSFMALQSLFMTCVLQYSYLTEQPLPKRIKKMACIILFLCILRAWLWSERLALIELLFPVILVKIATIRTYHRLWLVFAPLIGIFVLVIIFSAGEYFRSWQIRQHQVNLSFIEYVVARLAGYYATAINNGAAFIQNRDPYYFPINTAQWFHKFPLWSILDIKTIDSNFSAQDFLSTYANLEFTNPSGLYMPYLDYGFILGTLCWGILGAVSAWFMLLYRNRSLTGLIFYPIWFIGIAEILRIFYWGGQRFFPVIVASYLVISYLKSHQQRAA